MNEDIWYSPDNFRYTKKQIIWLLGWLPVLREDGMDWPPSHKESGYVESKQPRRSRFSLKNIWQKIFKRRGRYYEARWENCRSIRGYLENRLCKMGLDGLMIKAIYSWHEDYEDLARYVNLPRKVLIKRVEDALNKIVEKEMRT